MYAVVRTGGKQYRVEEGRTVKVERLAGEVGDAVEIGDVLLMDDGSGVTVGAPTIDGARVLGTIAEQGRSKKVIVFRYKAKTRYRKKTGHRQHFTKVVVQDILLPGQEPKPKTEVAPAEAEAAPQAEAPKGRRSRKAADAAEPQAVSDEAVAEANAAATADVEAIESAEAAEAGPAEKPKRSRRKAE